MPYAASNIVSTDQIDGGVYISCEQYLAALDGMAAGLTVVVDGDGFRLLARPGQDADPAGHGGLNWPTPVAS